MSPESLGKYRIVRRIAAGRTTEILEAHLDGAGGFQRSFALKRVRPELAGRPELVEALVEEARFAGLLSHANIVQIMDLGEHAGAYFVAMEYVDGPDLGRVLARCAEKGITLPVPHAVFVAIELLKALEYAHARQVVRSGRLVALDVVHAAIAPDNVLLSFQGAVKLADFGSARSNTGGVGAPPPRPRYAAPEQLAGEAVDARADIWSTGVLLHEMLTGENPFAVGPGGEERDDEAIAEAVRQGAHLPASHVNPDVPYPLEEIVERALRVAPAERFESATEMKEALDRFFHEAGFIFSHSTLAAFLKGLFPEAAGAEGPDPSIQAAVPTVALSPEDRPTAVEPAFDESMDEALASADTVLRPAPAPPAAADGPVAGLGDDRTLIRDHPLVDDARAWSEAETALRTNPAAPPRRAAAAPAAAPAPAPVAEAARAPAPPSEDTLPELDVEERHPLVYLAVGAVVTMVVLFVGALIGISVYRMTAEPPAAVAATRHDPEIEVHLPAEAALYVDGRKIDGGASRRLFLKAGEHTVRVELPGRAPVETALRLQDNDVRILSFQVETLPEER